MNTDVGLIRNKDHVSMGLITLENAEVLYCEKGENNQRKK
jgi:hypothetical protein